MPQMLDKERIGDTIVMMVEEEGPFLGDNLRDLREQLGLSHISNRVFRSALWHARVAGRVSVSRVGEEHRSMGEHRPFKLARA